MFFSNKLTANVISVCYPQTASEKRLKNHNKYGENLMHLKSDWYQLYKVSWAQFWMSLLKIGRCATQWERHAKYDKVI